MFRDHKVRYLAREGIASFALSWWRAADRRGKSFNICAFVIEVLAKRLRGKGQLQIKLYSAEELPERACVTFDPLTLHIDREIWHDADVGEPYARFIVAHEIGHIVLHDKFAVAFSNDREATLKYVEKEESGEEQANAFADLFLVPDHVALHLNDADSIAGLCVVTDSMAERRLREARATKHPIMPRYDGEMCGECGHFALARDGICIKCDSCGSTVGCL